MSVELLFPTPIWTSEVQLPEELDLYQQELNSVMTRYKDLDMRNPWGDTVETSFKKSNRINILDEMPQLKAWIMTNVREYLKTFPDCPDPRITESWWNISRQGGFQHWHTHAMNDITGVWFHQTSGQDGNLMFRHEGTGLTHGVFSPGYHSVIPKIGKLVLFPSWLEHAVWLNKTDSERITVSFNMKLLCP